MARKPKSIVSPTGGTPTGGELPPRLIRTIDFGLGVQRPVVLAHIRSIRRRHPDATPEQLIRILERRYMAATTTGGAAVGATAVIPGIGTGMTLVLSGIETAGFLEATALYAQSVAEVHGIAVADPDRARALIMTMMLGSEGTDLVRQLAGQVSGDGVARAVYWGELVTNNLPRAIMGPLADRLKTMFIRRFSVGAGASVVSKAIPFGVGAVIGGVGNRIISGRVVHASRLAFGVPPITLPAELEPAAVEIVLGEDGSVQPRRRGLRSVGRVGVIVGDGISRASSAVGSGIAKTTSSLGDRVTRGRKDGRDQDGPTTPALDQGQAPDPSSTPGE
ncbi:MAG: hypothetical protein ABWY36_01340 [Leifsonia sp.]